jgi:hypothetical protein
MNIIQRVWVAGLVLSFAPPGCASDELNPELEQSEGSEHAAAPTQRNQEAAATAAASVAPASSSGESQDATVHSTTDLGPVSRYSSSEPIRMMASETDEGLRFELTFRVQDEDGNGVSIDVIPYSPEISEWSVNDGVDGGLGLTVSGPSMDGPASEAHAVVTYPDPSSIRFDLSGVVIGHHGNPDNPGEITSTSSVPDGFVTGSLEMACLRLGKVVATGPGSSTREPPQVDEDWSSEFCQMARSRLAGD